MLFRSKQAFFVAGVWRDYANQSGSVIVRLADYRRLTGDTTVTDAALGSLRPHTGYSTPLPLGARPAASLPRGLAEAAAQFLAPFDAPSVRVELPPAGEIADGNFPLGVARAQLHETYIVAQTPQGVVIVDQHAAHERLLHEKLKHQLEAEGIKRQALLLPEVVEVGEDGARRLTQRAEIGRAHV